MSFAGKVCLVTGAASGIGAAVARKLLLERARVVATDVASEGLQKLGREFPQNLHTVETDISQESGHIELLEQCQSKFGGLDMAVNSAGILQPPMILDEISEDLFDRLIAVNLKGIFLSMKHQIVAMRQRGGGSIVNLSSVAGLKGAAFLSVYAATKHAVCGLTRSAALENAAHNIRINSLCPGVVDTPMVATINAEKLAKLHKSHPMGRIGTTNEVTEAALWLLSNASSFTTGANLPVDGGFTA